MDSRDVHGSCAKLVRSCPISSASSHSREGPFGSPSGVPRNVNNLRVLAPHKGGALPAAAGSPGPLWPGILLKWLTLGTTGSDTSVDPPGTIFVNFRDMHRRFNRS